ncbi:MAG: imidazole glycerol phosphate synthase subunit HisF, partial [Lachnospiraceae bacterium]|nr:imidazole glycerol phosphate synthase subunit HisF [Lachnospiraceae bacterium]
MLTKRIIPCLDVKDGRVVKGINFINLIDAGDPVDCAKAYSDLNADELVFLDITATSDDRKTMVEVINKVAKNVFIPLTVGGGIRTTDDMRALLMAGADKISINSSAVKRPDLINEGATIFGNQCIVVAIDAKKENDSFKVYVNGGRVRTDLDVIDWAREVEK